MASSAPQTTALPPKPAPDFHLSEPTKPSKPGGKRGLWLAVGALTAAAAVIRKGKVITPHGQMTFEAEDEVLAVVDNASLEALRSFLA
jgi:hypothetical protein